MVVITDDDYFKVLSDHEEDSFDFDTLNDVVPTEPIADANVSEMPPIPRSVKDGTPKLTRMK